MRVTPSPTSTRGRSAKLGSQCSPVGHITRSPVLCKESARRSFTTNEKKRSRRLPDNGEKPEKGVEQPILKQGESVPARYVGSTPDKELRQSEIISDLSQFIFDHDMGEVAEEKCPHGIVLTQDCDLLRDFEAAREGKPLVLSGVLIYPLEVAAEAKAKLPRGVSWQPVMQNNNERFHYFPEVPPECDCMGKGLPAL
jgi:hypothetical protein